MMPQDPLFNPGRNPFQDAHAAVQRAIAEQKNILLEIGGDWCIWCHRLEKFITSHPELLYLRSMHYIHLRIHADQDWSENRFINNLPAFGGLPHFFIYNPQGTLLHSQDTAVLEEGESYNYEKVWEFLASWSIPPSQNRIM